MLDPLSYETDDTGTFTDTANYVDLIGECTNISVGYYDQHTKKESLDTEHLFRLRDALLTLDTDNLIRERQPGDYEELPRYTFYSETNWRRLVDIIKDNPHEVANWLEDYGITAADLKREIFERTGYAA